MTRASRPDHDGDGDDSVRTLVVSGTLTLDTTERAGVVHAEVPGGSALYAAAAGSLLLPTRVLGIVGDDFPFDTLAPLWARGADRAAVEVVPGRTFRWHARYAPDGNTRETLSRDRGVAEGRLPTVPSLPTGRYALLLGSTDPRVQRHVREACATAAVVGLDSMAHWWRDRAEALRALLAQVDVLFVDEDELVQATGDTDATAAAARVLALGPGVVVVKRGARGAWMQRRDGAPVATAAAPVREVVDTTGAGDAFAGAFMAALAQRPARPDDEVLRVAAAIAAWAVESVGTTALLAADRAALERRLAG